jgi:hypothetical protein
MYDLVDNLTFKLHSISPNLRPVFELTYELFKSDTVDFLEGKCFFLGAFGVLLTFGVPGVEMLPSLDNFVSYGSDVIKTRTPRGIWTRTGRGGCVR